MDRVKGITKNGYHPTGKDGGKESWRGDYKGINQVVGALQFHGQTSINVGFHRPAG